MKLDFGHSSNAELNWWMMSETTISSGLGIDRESADYQQERHFRRTISSVGARLKVQAYFFSPYISYLKVQNDILYRYLKKGLLAFYEISYLMIANLRTCKSEWQSRIRDIPRKLVPDVVRVFHYATKQLFADGQGFIHDSRIARGQLHLEDVKKLKRNYSALRDAVSAEKWDNWDDGERLYIPEQVKRLLIDEFQQKYFEQLGDVCGYAIEKSDEMARNLMQRRIEKSIN